MSRQGAYITIKLSGNRIAEARVAEIKDILYNIVSKRILDEDQGMVSDLGDEL